MSFRVRIWASSGCHDWAVLRIMEPRSMWTGLGYCHVGYNSQYWIGQYWIGCSGQMSMRRRTERANEALLCQAFPCVIMLMNSRIHQLW